MATPTVDELLTGHTEWFRTHRGVRYLVAFHGYRNGQEYVGADPHPGTWCWYLLIPQQMYPHRWDDFAVKVASIEGSLPPFFYHTEPAAFEDLPFHGGITWSSTEPTFDRKTGQTFDQSKIGCDYNHLWDREGGYFHTFNMVCRDAEYCVEAFLERHPDHHLRSDWSGRWDQRDRFYTAINGKLAHVEDVIPDDYEKWKPAEPAPATQSQPPAS